MKHLFAQLRPDIRRPGLRRNDSGNVIMTFAICVFAIAAIIGLAVDSRRIDTTKVFVQTAVDAATVAGAREYLLQSAQPVETRETAARAAAIAAYRANMATVGTDVTIKDPVISFPSEGAVEVTATETLPMALGGLFNRPSVDLNVAGTAEAGDRRKVELVLALDNTSSMFADSRFTLMRDAAKGFVNTMFDETPAPDLMAISVVPWAATVNINSERPGTWNAAAVAASATPISGSRRSPNAPFENRMKYLLTPDGSATYASAADLASDFAPVEWRGCIRGRPGERVVDSTDTVANRLTDAAPATMRWPVSLLGPELDTDPTTPKPPSTPKPPQTPKPNTGPKPPSVPKPPKPPRPGPQGWLPSFGINGLLDTASVWTAPDTSKRALDCDQSSVDGGYPGLRNVYLPTTVACTENNHTPATKTRTACVSDPNEFDYFADGNAACVWQDAIFPWDQTRPISGPNMNCPTAMLGLSGDRSQIIEKLDHMHPVPHGTHADLGLMWGLRALSPRTDWVNFFGHTGTAAPRAFGGTDVRKVMVLLTDGANEEPYDYEGYYGCTQPGNRGSAGKCASFGGVTKPSRATLDALTLDACTELRDNYGVEVYTIAVNVTDAAAISLLSTCAGASDRAFNITAAQLGATFEAIAARELRITD